MENQYSLIMNQLVEKFSNFSLLRNCSGDLGNFILSISSKYGVDAKTAAPYAMVILGGICFLIYISNNWPKHKPTSPDLPTDLSEPMTKSHDHPRSWIVREIYSGEPVLERLDEDIKIARVNSATLANMENLLKALLEEEHLDLMKLQQTVAKLEMSRSEDSAVKILEEAVKKAKDANKPHEAYEIEMLLVEMLIYKGDSNNALKRKCLKDKLLKDARRPLYQAIIYQMRGNRKKSNEYWEEFLKVRKPPNGEMDFEQFQKIVGKLQNAIKESTERRG